MIKKMKYHLGILLFIFLIYSVNAQEKFHKVSINLAISHPILKKNYFPNYRYSFDKEIDIVLNFKISKSSILSAGIGLGTAEHFREEYVNKLIWIEGFDYLPTEYTLNWKLDYKSVYFPVYFEAPINNSILDFLVLGTKIGWIWDYDLSERKIQDATYIRINKSFLDFHFGVEKKLIQSEKASLGLLPILGSRIYLSNNNDWQNSYFFYQIKFYVNF